MQEVESKVRTQKPEKLRERQNRGKLETEAPPTLLQPPEISSLLKPAGIGASGS